MVVMQLVTKICAGGIDGHKLAANKFIRSNLDTKPACLQVKLLAIACTYLLYKELLSIAAQELCLAVLGVISTIHCS